MSGSRLSRGARGVVRVVVLGSGAAALAAGVAVAAAGLPAGSVPRAATTRLPLVTAAAVPMCPGPATRTAPEGSSAVDYPGTVSAHVLVTAAGALLPAGGTGGDDVAARLAPGTGDASSPVLSLRAAAGASAGTAGDGLAADRAGPYRVDVARATVAAAPDLAVSALQVSLARTGDLRGLAVTACGTAAVDQWLVGGGTATGRRARLLLANPGTAPAVADVVVHGPKGPVASGLGEGVVVPAGGQVAVFLDALAPGLDAVAVRVHATTGRVVAVLDDEVMRGLVPGGTESVVPGAPASTRQVVPGLAVAPAAALPGGRQPADPDAAGANAVRVVNPGTGDAVVRLTLLGPSGAVDLPGSVLTVPAGSVAQVPVTGVPSAIYAAVVRSDTPVVAAGVFGRARSARPPAVGAADLAWSPSATPVTGTVASALPPGTGRDAVTSMLALAAPDAAGSLRVTQLDAAGVAGATTTVQVAAGSSTYLRLDAGSTGVVLRPAGGGRVTAGLMAWLDDAKGALVAAAPLRGVAGGAGSPGRPVVVEDPALGVG